ncbi:MAG: right-handed parallel beta-helix repeat-containing protein [Bryobacteraceae bacterium]
MFRTSIILFGFSLGLLTTQVQATTYYIDAGAGNDFHAGAQTTAAWKSLRYASSPLYHPGDQILFKAGSVWQGETLDIATSDEPGDPIVIGSYGTGAQPVIDGLSSASSPITLRNGHNVTISNLTIQNAKILINITGGSNITVRNCTLRNASTYAVDVGQTTGFTFSNNTYTTTGTFKQSGHMLQIVASVNGVKVTGNRVTFNQASRGAVGFYIINVDNAVVSGNTVIGGSQGIGVKGVNRSVTGAQVYNNSIYNSDNREGDGESIEFTGWKNTSYRVSGSIHHNFIKGGAYTTNAIGAYQSSNVLCYNNVVVGPMQNAAIHWSQYSTGASIYGNTIHNVRVGFGIFSGSSATVRNNIVSKAEVAMSVSSAKVTEDYNIFYGSGAISSTVAKGGHNSTANPRFVSSSPAGPLDVRLQSGSPAIHSGSALTSSYRYALNPASTAFPCSMFDQSLYGWDRGAFGHK